MPDRTMSDFDKGTRNARNEVLTSSDINFVSEANGNETNMLHVVGDTQNLIWWCYEFGVNALTFLREYFPDFEWEYMEFDHKKPGQFLDHFFDQDYTWIALKGGEWCQSVSARRKNMPKDEAFKRFVGEDGLSKGMKGMIDGHHGVILSLSTK